MKDVLPCLDLLEATPAILRGLMSEISEEDVRWKPAADRFSIAEVLSHLSHPEARCYRARLDRFLAEERPEFEPDDAQMHLDLYRNAHPEEDFAHFEDQRENNMELLRGLPAETGGRKAWHWSAGEITLSQMLHEWALHDIGHIRQIAELARARKYLAGSRCARRSTASRCMRRRGRALSTRRAGRRCCATCCALRWRRSGWSSVPTAWCASP